jgi:hypothetical protein
VGGRKRAEAIQARKKAEAAERQALLARPCPVWAAPCTRPIRAWPASSMPWARTSTAFLLMAQVRVQ